MANIYDMADTWNNGATTFTAIKMNVTDTASNAASLLLDLQVGGSSKASVKKDGLLSTIYASLSGQSLTGSAATSLLDLAATWNTSGTPTAVKLNVTDTASNASSLLMDLRVGGVSKISFTKDGSINATSGAITSYNVAANANLRVSSGVTFNASTSGAVVTTLFGLNGTSATAAPDVSIMRSAAAVLGIRNGSTGGGALEYIEQTAPAAGAANSCRVYAVDNGAGKTQLMALFGSGAAQQLAIEP